MKFEKTSFPETYSECFYSAYTHYYPHTNKTVYARMDKVKFVEDSLRQIISLGRLLQILLCSFLNTLSQIREQFPIKLLQV